MSSEALGRAFSGLEITHVSTHGIWLLTGDRELFLPYDEFPWFADAPLRQVLNVREESAGHFHWPDLDVDLTIDIILHPDRFPLKACVTTEGAK